MEEQSKSSRASMRRRPKSSASAASSPAPSGHRSNAACGHDGCGHTCSVRYVGPVSHLRDHHALHAARGVAHVWTAAIVSGLAVVLTGVLAYSAQAARDSSSRRGGSAELRAVMERLDRLETSIQEVSQHCLAVSAAEQDGEQQDDRTTTGTDQTQQHNPSSGNASGNNPTNDQAR